MLEQTKSAVSLAALSNSIYGLRMSLENANHTPIAFGTLPFDCAISDMIAL